MAQHYADINVAENMKFVHTTLDDSKPGCPHFEVNAFENDEWVGNYQRRGDWIEQVFVAENMRGRGICGKMLRHAKSKKKYLRLEVLANNNVAQHCYKKAKFKQHGKPYPSQWGDMVEMRWRSTT